MDSDKVISGPGLPPMTVDQAMDVYSKTKGLGAAIVAMMDPEKWREMILGSLAAIVVLGDKLMDQHAALEEQTEVMENMGALLRTYVSSHLDEQLKDENLVPEGEITVAWAGAGGDFWDNQEAIVHEIVSGLTEAVDEKNDPDSV